MAAGDATAADVPGKYDVVINGKGYCFLDSLEESIPFRTHRAVYGLTPPFVERQNVSNSYGDNTQDFFLTIRQRNWSLGEQQKFFRDGRYWMGTNLDVTVPGEVSLRQPIGTISLAENVFRASTFKTHDQGSVYVVGAGSLYSVAQSGTITNAGVHGLGTNPIAMANDGTSVFLSSTGGGTVGVRRYNGAYSTFSATPADSLAFLNNTLYGYDNANNRLIQYDTAGVSTILFTWKDAAGAAAASPVNVRMVEYGGQLAIMRQTSSHGTEVWIYDGSGVTKAAELPTNFIGWQMVESLGVLYITGSFLRNGSPNTLRPAVFFLQSGTLGFLWQASDVIPVAGDAHTSVHPGIDQFDGGLVFSDDTTGSYLFYNPIMGGVHSIGSYTVANDSSIIVGTDTFFFNIRNSATAYRSGSTSAAATSGTVISSLVDFDSSLSKVFRGVTVEFASASDGNGGTVDVSYQLGSLTGSWTSLQTGVASGTEVAFPANITGHSVAVKVTLNKGTSTNGPTLKSLSVRGAPIMPIYPRGEYIFDCTNTEDVPRELRDGMLHPLTGYEQVQNLVTARNSTTPVSITDKVNGTYTGFVDVNDAEGFDVYEIHPSTDNPRHAGSYVVRLTTRGV